MRKMRLLEGSSLQHLYNYSNTCQTCGNNLFKIILSFITIDSVVMLNETDKEKKKGRWEKGKKVGKNDWTEKMAK